MGGVFGAEMHGGDFFFSTGGGDGREFGLDKAFEVGQWLLRVDEKGQRFDVFAVRVLVKGGQRDDEF